MLNKTDFTKKRKNGFTFVEVLTVVLILGLLAAIALPTYHKYMQKSRVAQAVNLLHIVKDKQVAAVSKSVNRSYIDSVSGLGRLTSNSKEVLEEDKLLINDNYTLTLNDEKQCAIVNYAKGNSNFSVAIAYDKPGLGCSGNVCKGFEDVLGETDSVCVPSGHQPDCEYTNCECGFIWSYDKCECLQCPACPEGQHFACSGCKCEPDDPLPPEPPEPPTCEGTCSSDERKVCSFDENCNCNCQCKGEYPISINNGQECSTCQETCGESYINWDSDSGKCSSCGEGSEVVNGECWACPEGTHWVVDTTTDGINSDLCIGPRGHCEQDCTGASCCEGETVWDPSEGRCRTCDEMYPAYFQGNHYQEGRPIWVNGECKSCEEIDSSRPAYGEPLQDVLQYEQATMPTEFTDSTEGNDGVCSKGGNSADCNTQPTQPSGPRCISCYEKYGTTRPVWHAMAHYCMSCAEANPPKVRCPSTGSGYASLPNGTFREYLTDYLASNTDVNSYALQTGALLAARLGENGSGIGDITIIDDPGGTTIGGENGGGGHLCGSSGATQLCSGYTFTSLSNNCKDNNSYQNLTGVTNVLCKEVDGTIGICNCSSLGGGNYGWVCNPSVNPTTCRVVSPCSGSQVNYDCTPIFRAIYENTWDDTQGDCNSTWHGATRYVQAKPKWVGGVDGSCQPCGEVSVDPCLSRYDTYSNPTATSSAGYVEVGNADYVKDLFSGQVWNGESCVDVNSVIDNSSISVSGRCFFQVWGVSNVICKGTGCTQMNWVRGQLSNYVGQQAASQTVQNMISSSNDQVINKRTGYTKEYYAVTRLGIAPSEMGKVIRLDNNGPYY